MVENPYIFQCEDLGVSEERKIGGAPRETLLGKLEKADKVFYDLKLNAWGSADPQWVEPSEEEMHGHFLTAAYAAIRIRSVGRAVIEAAEMRGRKIYSFKHGSLAVAEGVISDYICGERSFGRDDYEQLGRICVDAKKLLEGGVF